MLDNINSKQEKFKRRLEAIMGIPFTSGNWIEVLRNGDEIFPKMLTAIENAKTSIELATYVYWTGEIADKFAEALAEKAKQGVTVRVLLDSFGAAKMNKELIELMENAGVFICWFRPLTSFRFSILDNRTHRKILIVDDEVGFTGGVGIAKEWQGNARNIDEWRDSHFLLRGPAIDGLRGAFVANWAETGDYSISTMKIGYNEHQAEGEALIQVIRSTASASWSDIVTLLHALVDLAEESIKISTAYFVLDRQMLKALKKARARGVSIDIVIPGDNTDQTLSKLGGQNNFSELLKVGINICAYQPTMLHTKIVLVDRTLACVGSPNFNQRSMGKDEEIAMCVIDKKLEADLNEHFNDDISKSKPYDLEKWKKRRTTTKIKEWFMSHIKGQL